MSSSKCYNLEAKNVIHFKLCNQTDKRSNCNLRYCKAFKMGFMYLEIKIKEKFSLKTKLTKSKIQKSILYKICRICSASKRCLNFQNQSTGSGNITSGAKRRFSTLLKSQKEIKRGSMILNFSK